MTPLLQYVLVAAAIVSACGTALRAWVAWLEHRNRQEQKEK